MDDSRVKKASDLVANLVSPEAAREGGRWSGFFSAWARVAGERAAAHTRIIDVRQGLVLVEADHPGWIQTLQFRQGSMLAELKSRFPELELRGIAFRAGRDPVGAASAQIPPSPAERNREAWSLAADGSSDGLAESQTEPKEREPAALPTELGSLLADLKRALSGSTGSD